MVHQKKWALRMTILSITTLLPFLYTESSDTIQHGHRMSSAELGSAAGTLWRHTTPIITDDDHLSSMCSMRTCITSRHHNVYQPNSLTPRINTRWNATKYISKLSLSVNLTRDEHGPSPAQCGQRAGPWFAAGRAGPSFGSPHFWKFLQQ